MATTANTPSDYSAVRRRKRPTPPPRAVAPAYGAKLIGGSGDHLAGRGLSMLGQAQSSVAAVAAVGHQTVNAPDPGTKPIAQDQSGHHRSRLGSQKAPAQNASVRAHKPGTLLKHHIPIKTDSWDVHSPGFTEIDRVSHSGNSASGDFLHSLNVTDIHCTWVETRAVMGKSQIGVLDAMKDIQQALPF